MAAQAPQPTIPARRKNQSGWHYPLGRLVKRKGQAPLRETTAQLGGVKTLGDDADILVLKEVGEMGEASQKEPQIMPEIAYTAPVDAPNLLASLEKDEAPVSLDEVNKQLDTLRPSTHAAPDDPQYVSQATFIKLGTMLLKGFTVRQLSHYYSVAKSIKPKNLASKLLDGFQRTAKRPLERTEWHPGQTNIELRLPGFDTRDRPKGKPVSKRLLVDRILRDVWRLNMLEEIEAPGEIELELKPWQLALLTSGPVPTPLDKIGTDRKVKIEIHRKHGVVRVTADKNTAEYAADDIEQLLQHTERKGFQLAPWEPFLEGELKMATAQLFPGTSLDLIAGLTGAYVEHTQSSVLIIRGLNRSVVAEAERCIMRLLPLRNSVTYTSDTARRDANLESSLLPIYFEKSSLDFLSREQKWGRWSMPVARMAEPPAKDTLKEDDSSKELVSLSNSGPRAQTSKESEQRQNKSDESSILAELGDVQARVLQMTHERPNMSVPGRAPGHYTHWFPRADQTLTAEFGQVLYSVSQSHSSPKITASSSDDPPTPSTPPLLQSIPGLFRLISSPTFTHPICHPPALVYDFVAAPEQQNFKKGQEYPSLHVQFRHDQQLNKPVFWKMQLGFDERVHDVLLPDKAVDIRFRRHQRLTWKPDKIDEARQGEGKVAKFMEEIMANITSGEKLSAPGLDLEIPKWTIPNYSNTVGKESGTRTVKYLFTGIRFHQSLTANYLDTPVSYNTVQSGKLGKKGGAFSAHFRHKAVSMMDSEEKKMWEKDSKNLGEERVKEWVKTVFQMAESITKESQMVGGHSVAQRQFAIVTDKSRSARAGVISAEVAVAEDEVVRLNEEERGEVKDVQALSEDELVERAISEAMPYAFLDEGEGDVEIAGSSETTAEPPREARDPDAGLKELLRSQL